MRISDWSSDVCSSDLGERLARRHVVAVAEGDVVVPGEGEGDAGNALGRRGRVVGRGSAREAQQGLAGPTVVAEEGSGVALVAPQLVSAGQGNAQCLPPGGCATAAELHASSRST